MGTFEGLRAQVPRVRQQARQAQAAAADNAAKPLLIYLAEYTFDPGFVSGGKEYLVATAGKASEGPLRAGAECGLSARSADAIAAGPPPTSS